MTRITMASLMVLLGGIGATFGNTQISADVSSASMNVCGVDIELGSPPKAVFERLAGTECMVAKVTDDPDSFAIGKPGAVIASLKFSHGMLVVVRREWASGIKSTDEFARAVVNALQEVQAKGSSQCVLSAFNQADPAFEAKGSEMTCGPRTLVFSVTVESGKQSFQIEELLVDEQWQRTSAKSLRSPARP